MTLLTSTDGALNEWSHVGAATARQLASLTFLTALLALAGGRHYLSPVLPSREKEALLVAYVLYFLFGMVDDVCGVELICGVFVLSFEVIKILLTFCVLIFFNMAADQIRRASGHSWAQLRGELLRLVTFRQLRVRVLLVYLILPIVFMFLEVVLDWRSEWFKLLRQGGLDLYMVVAFASRIPPTAYTYDIHFAHLRRSTGQMAGGRYATFFRWLLGSHVDPNRAPTRRATGGGAAGLPRAGGGEAMTASDD